MIEWFKAGKTLPRRIVWEIVLGAYDCFCKEESLVNVDLAEGETCDVIGDVHGEPSVLFFPPGIFFCSKFVLWVEGGARVTEADLRYYRYSPHALFPALLNRVSNA